MGLKLVEPKTAQANKDIKLIATSIVTQGLGVWIGIDDKSKEGKFAYASDGKSIKFTNWAYGQPDNYRDEDCAHLWNEYGFKWNDLGCSKKNSFICETK